MIQVEKAQLPSISCFRCAEIPQIVGNGIVAAVPLQDHPVNQIIHIQLVRQMVKGLLLGHVLRLAVLGQKLQVTVPLSGFFLNLHIGGSHGGLLAVEHLADVFLQTVNTVVLAVYIENAKFIMADGHAVS